MICSINVFLFTDLRCRNISFALSCSLSTKTVVLRLFQLERGAHVVLCVVGLGHRQRKTSVAARSSFNKDFSSGYLSYGEKITCSNSDTKSRYIQSGVGVRSDTYKKSGIHLADQSTYYLRFPIILWLPRQKYISVLRRYLDCRLSSARAGHLRKSP